ncbi:hypothetical protein [Nitrosomonas communis]|uniref:hypothetical protein n=1 Tax=Nitrosomonas communis TaxID=44574 RepID=UPI003D2C1A0C
MKGAKPRLCAAGRIGLRRTHRRNRRKISCSCHEAFLGRAVVPDDSPFTTGGIGLLGTLPSELAMEECDSLLIIGSNMLYVNYYPKAGQARAVQIDSDPSHLGWRYRSKPVW